MLLICLAGMISRIVASTRSAERGGLLDACPGSRPEMQLDLAAVDGREKILPQARQRPNGKGQNRGGDHGAQKNRRKARAALQRRAEQRW